MELRGLGMGQFILRRLGVMILMAICLTAFVFCLTNLYPNLEKLARSQGTPGMEPHQVAIWLSDRGYRAPLHPDVLDALDSDDLGQADKDALLDTRINLRLIRNYGEWLGLLPGFRGAVDGGKTIGRCIDAGVHPDDAPDYCGVLQGNWGYSPVFEAKVGDVMAARLWQSGKLLLWALILMVPAALTLGVLAGLRQGSGPDRSVPALSSLSSATPEYVSGVILIALLTASTMGLTWPWSSAANTAEGAALPHVALPAFCIAFFGLGRFAQMTRASMAEVLATQYIRTARLKGIGFGTIVFKHALRNALIAPVTSIMRYFPWLLSGLVIVETLFDYRGLGWTLVQAARGNDIELLLGCATMAVMVVLIARLISDVGAMIANPRIRLA